MSSYREMGERRNEDSLSWHVFYIVFLNQIAKCLQLVSLHTRCPKW